MSELKTEILDNLLNYGELLEDLETSRFKQFEDLLEELSNKFCDCLPPELQKGFKSLVAIYFTFSCESRDIGQTMGLKTAYALFSLLQNPKESFERLTQNQKPITEANALDINTIKASIANYKKEREEADT